MSNLRTALATVLKGKDVDEPVLEYLVSYLEDKKEIKKVKDLADLVEILEDYELADDAKEGQQMCNRLAALLIVEAELDNAGKALSSGTTQKSSVQSGSNGSFELEALRKVLGDLNTKAGSSLKGDKALEDKLVDLLQTLAKKPDSLAVFDAVGEMLEESGLVEDPNVTKHELSYYLLPCE